MKRVELIEQLEYIQANIEQVEKQINEKYQDDKFYVFFSTEAKFNHLKEIRIKALAYWKRRFNRVLNELSY